MCESAVVCAYILWFLLLLLFVCVHLPPQVFSIQQYRPSLKTGTISFWCYAVSEPWLLIKVNSSHFRDTSQCHPRCILHTALLAVNLFYFECTYFTYCCTPLASNVVFVWNWFTYDSALNRHPLRACAKPQAASARRGEAPFV